MKSFDIFIAMENINEYFIDEAMPEKKESNVIFLIKVASVIAACVCLVAGGLYVNRYIKSENLPLLTVEKIDFGGMGFEGTDSLSIEYSQDINPWNENIILTTLPVYKNLCYRYEGQKKSCFSEKDLIKKAEKTADCFGEKITSTQVYADDTDSELVYSLVAQTENSEISVTGAAVSITFKNPEEHNDISAVKMKYPFLFNDNDVLGIHQNFSIDGEPFQPNYKKYTTGETVEENIVNYNLHYMLLFCGDNNKIDFVQINNYTDCSEKLGDYPIITVDEAKAKLFNGQYVTSVDEEAYISDGKVEESFVKKIDLIYYTGNNQQLFMPYYRFYVLLDLFPFERTGLPEDYEHYGYFYVPAVPEKYFENYELFDGEYQ